MQSNLPIHVGKYHAMSKMKWRMERVSNLVIENFTATPAQGEMRPAQLHLNRE